MSSLHGESSARKSRPASSFGPWLRHPAAAIVAAYIVFAAACSSSIPVRVSPGETTDAVLNSAGPPSAERTLPDGTKALYWARGPGGFTTYRVRVAQDGRVIDNVQLLTEKNFMDSLVAGKTSERDVLDNLGPPGAVSRHPNLDEVVWTYRWLNVTQSWLLDVHLNQTSGLVTTYTTNPQRCPSLLLQC